MSSNRRQMRAARREQNDLQRKSVAVERHQPLNAGGKRLRAKKSTDTTETTDNQQVERRTDKIERPQVKKDASTRKGKDDAAIEARRARFKYKSQFPDTVGTRRLDHEWFTLTQVSDIYTSVFRFFEVHYLCQIRNDAPKHSKSRLLPYDEMFVKMIDMCLAVVRVDGHESEDAYYKEVGVRMGTKVGIEVRHEALNEPILMLFDLPQKVTGEFLLHRMMTILDSNQHIDIDQCVNIRFVRRTGEGFIVRREIAFE